MTTEKPWIANRPISTEQAATMIGELCGDFVVRDIESFGEGWDATAFLVCDADDRPWVFRFARRQLGAEALANEAAVMPQLGPHLPAPVPISEIVVHETETGWPLLGHRLVPGRTACSLDLNDGQRAALAEPLAKFLRALHNAPPFDAIGPDTFGRLDVAKRVPQHVERLHQAVELGLLDSVEPWKAIAERIEVEPFAEPTAVVHGDLYARHILLNDDAEFVGVIDWGDVHRNDPGVDLSLVHLMLPPHAHETFYEHYGPVSDRTRDFALLKALSMAAGLLVFSHDANDADLMREGRRALERIAEAKS